MLRTARFNNKTMGLLKGLETNAQGFATAKFGQNGQIGRFFKQKMVDFPRFSQFSQQEVLFLT